MKRTAVFFLLVFVLAQADGWSDADTDPKTFNGWKGLTWGSTELQVSNYLISLTKETRHQAVNNRYGEWILSYNNSEKIISEIYFSIDPKVGLYKVYYFFNSLLMQNDNNKFVNSVITNLVSSYGQPSKNDLVVSGNESNYLVVWSAKYTLIRFKYNTWSPYGKTITTPVKFTFESQQYMDERIKNDTNYTNTYKEEELKVKKANEEGSF
jgi:hypothetical protein